MSDLEKTVTDYWSTSVSDISPGVIRLHGVPVEQIIEGLGIAETVWLMLRAERPTRTQARLLEAALVASVDHGPQAPSIASARMAVTCGLPLNNAMATGVNLLGDTHGGAGQQCLGVYEQVLALEDDGTSLDAAVTEVLAAHRASGRHVPGFGHRFHPRDPRRDPLLTLVSRAVEQREVAGRHLAVALETERQLSTGRTRPVPMNIDGVTATVYGELGFAPELCRGLFVLSRSVGILAHAWEERQQGRRIKGPLPPPLLARYTGPAPRDLPPPGPDQPDQP